MLPNEKSTHASKIIISVAGAVIVGLITMVIASQNRITAVEVKVQGIEQAIRDNRIENNASHQRIEDQLSSSYQRIDSQLREIIKDVRK